MSAARPNFGLHFVAVLTAVATFPLIFVGGLVTSHGAGLAVPDWPNSFGYNMFLFPPRHWVGGILYEHSHRLMGTVVGFCSILLVLFAYSPARSGGARRGIGIGTALAALLAVAAGVGMALAPHDDAGERLRSHLSHALVGFASLALIGFFALFARTREPRRWVRRLTLVVLAAVIFQGVLGGLRVIRLNLDLAIIHGCFAQAFFCLTALVVVVTSRWWTEAPELFAAKDAAAGRRLVRWAVVAVAVVYGQLVVGAVMRHYRAGLAIPDFPLAFGRLVPPTDYDQYRAVKHPYFVTDLALGLQGGPDFGPRDSGYARWMKRWPAGAPETVLESDDTWDLGAVWLHFGHRVGAVLVSIVLLTVVYRVVRLYRGRPLLLVPALLLAALLLIQLTLGALTVLLRKPADVASAHVAVGALVLVTTFVLAVRSMRLYRPRPAAAPNRGFEVLPVESFAGTRAAAVRIA